MSLGEGVSVGHFDMLLLTTVIEVCNPQNQHHTYTGRLIFHRSTHGNVHVLKKINLKKSLDAVCLHSSKHIGQIRTEVAPA